MKKIRKMHRIAVTGFENSGKTVFLTSLLWHLEEGGKKLEFRNKTNYTFNTAIHDYKRPKGFEKFEFIKFRRYLQDPKSVNRRWIEKTCGYSSFAVDFEHEPVTIGTGDRSDNCSDSGPMRTIKSIGKTTIKHVGKIIADSQQFLPFGHSPKRLEFFDFPGERMADYLIYLAKDFDDWSEEIIETNPEIMDYMDKLQDCKDENQLLDKYKRFLIKQFYTGKKHWVTPSCFSLDTEGHLLSDIKNEKGEQIDNVVYRESTEESTEQILKHRHTGIKYGKGHEEFCPVPNAFKSNNKRAYKKIKKAFRIYKKRVVDPFFKQFIKSECVIVLLDIDRILKWGLREYNDQRAAFKELWNAFCRLTGKKKKKIAFVVNKADSFLEGDRGKLTNLAWELVNKSHWSYKYNTRFFTCSPCSCVTEKNENGSALYGNVVENGAQISKELDYREIPKTWPKDEWVQNSFGIVSREKLVPRVSSNNSEPPEQFGLDSILEFALFDDTNTERQ